MLSAAPTCQPRLARDSRRLERFHANGHKDVAIGTLGEPPTAALTRKDGRWRHRR
jgi:hypothetical protein